MKLLGTRVCKLFPLVIALFFASALAGDLQPVKPAPKDKCPVCGMFVAKYPDFVAEILFKNGSYAVFDGVKDMFKYFLEVEKFDPARRPSDMASIYVTDYYGLTLADGFEAFYVLGSDVYGPMGRELIPFASEADAREFMIDHKGKSLLKFQEVTPEIIKSLDE